MKRARFLAIAVVAFLAACAPALVPGGSRDGQQVTITLEATSDLYGVTLSVLNATSADPRCAVQGADDTDLGCLLGDLPAGASTTVVVIGEPGQVYCAAFAFVTETSGVTSIRAYPCKVS